MFLEWDAYYASAYSLQVSSDGVVWNTVFSTTSEDGGTDSISLSGLSARYVRLESTAWSDNTLRVWLKEFQILGPPEGIGRECNGIGTMRLGAALFGESLRFG